MSHTLTKAQIDQLKVVLASVGLDVRPMPKPRKAEPALTARQILAKSKWYKPTNSGNALRKYQDPRYFSFVKTKYSFNPETRTYTPIAYED